MAFGIDDLIGAAVPTVLGGLLGGSSSSGGTQTASKEPWSAAAPWLQNQITTGQNLQNYYQANPLNSMQQQGYQNLAGALDNYQSNVAPALQSVANRLMGSNYTRSIGQQNYQQPSAGMPGQMQAMRPGVQQMAPAQMPQSMQQMQQPTGLLGPGVQQQFQQPQMDITQGYTPYGLLDFASLVPNVDKINKDAEAASNSKKPKTNDENTYKPGDLGSPYSGGN